MRKIILLYHFVIFIASILVNFVYMYEGSYRISLLISSQIICFIGFYYTYKFLLNYRIANLPAIRFLFIYNLIQVFSFSINGVSFKTIYGLQFFVFLRRYSFREDLFFKLELNIYQNQFYLNYNSSSELFFLGFNLIQFMLCIYFLNILLKKAKTS